MSSVEIDPTFVLKYLNDLGYRNITAEQLKEFIRDLKKLIKYDKTKEQSPHNKENADKYFDYMRGTESSRAHSRNAPCSASDDRKHIQSSTTSHPPDDRRHHTIFRTQEYSKSYSTQSKLGHLDTNRTSDDTTFQENVSHTNQVSRSRTRISEPKDVMWIRPKSESRAKKSDPVSLYHAYQNDWNRFKNQIPIDNKHLDLRWNIRKKTMG